MCLSTIRQSVVRELDGVTWFGITISTFREIFQLKLDHRLDGLKFLVFIQIKDRTVICTDNDLQSGPRKTNIASSLEHERLGDWHPVRDCGFQQQTRRAEHRVKDG